MKKILTGVSIVLISLFAISCESETTDQKEKKGDNAPTIDTNSVSFCNCIEPTSDYISKCETLFPTPQNELDSIQRRKEIAACTGEVLSMSDTLTRYVLDSINKAYESDLSLTIKEIPEEKEDPISEDCKAFLEEYAESIKSFSSLLKKIEKSPDDINLMIARPSQEEELYSFASKPQMFQCSQSESFKKQVEILNNKRDKLLSN